MESPLLGRNQQWALRWLPRNLLPLGMGLLQACAADSELGRTVVDVQWDTVWQTSITFMDSTIPSPGLLEYNRGQLFVVDRSTPRIVALDARSGAMLWKVGRMGAGPEEFAGVSALFPAREGGVAVVDFLNRRIVELSAHGEFARTVSIAGMGQQPNQVCQYDDRFLVADVFQPRLLESDSTGVLVEKLSPLWPDLVTAKWESHQVSLANNETGDRCLVALSTGRGFALLTSGEKPVIAPYVEEFEVYGLGNRVKEGKMEVWATYSASFVGDTVMLLFSGNSPNRLRWIDRYNSASGKYLDTYLLPFKTGRFAAGGGTLFVLDTSQTRIVALRARR